MKKRLLLLIFASVSGISLSQNFIKGLVTDSAKTPIPFCALALLNAKDSSLVKGNLSNDKGEYVFENIKKGNYFIKFSNVGFKESSTNTFIVDSSSKVELSPHILKSAGINLNEVSVSVFKPTVEFKKGVVILNAENDLLARGNTVLDLLKRLPGVIVDAQNNVSINGNASVRFLMDGRLQNIPTTQMIAILSGMSADAIKSIELIKNPPARYDAAGTAGLINIVTKKANLKGTSGYLSQGFSQGKRAREGTVLGLNYKNNKLSLFSNLSSSIYTFEDETELDRILNTTATTNAFNASGTIVNKRKTFNANAGIEYDFTKKTSAGIYFNDNLNIGEPVQIAKTQVLQGDAFNYDSFVYQTNHKQTYNSPTVNANLLHKLDSTGSQVQYQGDYSNIVGEEDKRIVNNFYDVAGAEVSPQSNYTTLIHNDYKILNQKVDLTKNFKKQLSLEAGVKGGFVTINSNSDLFLRNTSAGFYNGDTTFNNSYIYNERILAAYTTLSKSFDKIGFTAGIRAEQTDIDATNKSTSYKFKRSYFNLFPSGSLDYHINQKNTITTTYSYRIDRPNYDMMNPVRVFNDQLNYSVGNSELKPQYSNYINLDYNFNNFITTSINYNRTNTPMFYYTYTKVNSQVNIDTVFNMTTRNDFVISEFVQKQIKWYNFQLYTNYRYGDIIGSINAENVGRQTNQYYVSLNNEFKLPKDFKITINGWYASKTYDGLQTYYQQSNISLIVSKGFMNNKFNLTLGFYDVLWKEYGSHSSDLSNQYYYYRQKPDTRRVRVNLTWKFGKVRVEQKLNKSEDNSRFQKKA